MKICVWDTETTGFPVKEWRLDQQPYIIQFACITGEIDEAYNYTELSRTNIMIRPPISIPFGASQVNGIYDRDVAECAPMETHMDTILRALSDADTLSGHNIEYDEWVLAYELMRLGRDGEYAPVKTVCTMRSSTEYCQLQGRGFAYKPPKLSELHRFLFDEWFEWAHDAMVDVEATMRCFIELVRREVIVLETTNVMRLF
jgi:DNA polymerase III epsilon subunit-like protein